MFSKLAVFTVAAFAVFAAAAPMPGSNDINNSCNTGPVQCCNSVHKSDAPAVNVLKALMGLQITDVKALVGLQCSPLTAVGVGGGAKCSSQPVCCSNNSFEGIIAMGCSPVNVNV